MSSNEAKNAIAIPGPAWCLTPAYKLAKIQLVEARNLWSRDPFYKTEKGGFIRDSDVWATRDEAIAAGRERADAHQVKLAKQQATLAKRLANLDKELGYKN